MSTTQLCVTHGLHVWGRRLLKRAPLLFEGGSCSGVELRSASFDKVSLFSQGQVGLFGTRMCISTIQRFPVYLGYLAGIYTWEVGPRLPSLMLEFALAFTVQGSFCVDFLGLGRDFVSCCSRLSLSLTSSGVKCTSRGGSGGFISFSLDFRCLYPRCRGRICVSVVFLPVSGCSNCYAISRS